MVSTASALVFEERRSLIQVFPDSFIEFLNAWEVRVFIIWSLILQIILITLGNRRKYVCRVWIRITLWCAYLLADWVAIVALGLISKNTIDKCKKLKRGTTEDPLKDQLMWFWAQFFLLHLGGPDTITAYSLEDNELWLRHLVVMLIQTAVAFYVLLFSFQDGSFRLPVLGVLIFVAGVIKYAERLCALYASHSENFRDSMLTEPDAGPNYPKFMEDYTLKKSEGFRVDAAEVIETPVPSEHAFPTNSGKPIVESYEMLLKFKRLFADAILSFQDRDSSQLYFKNLSADEAFDVVEIELGFMFDELYTKASIVYNVGGLFSRLITFSFTLLALIGFSFLCDKSKHEKQLDVIITYSLLGVAICLEIYAVCVVINSNWTVVWVSRQDGKRHSSQVVRWLQCWLDKKKRWSNKMAQHNLLDLCVRERSAVWLRSHRLFRPVDNHIEKHWYKTFVDVSPELKRVIFEVLKSYMKNNEDPTSLWNRKKRSTLEKSLEWINEREFDQRILLWHIATDICYYSEEEEENGEQEWMEISKEMSNYMLYLLVACPFMLPMGIGMMRFRDTCAEAREFLGERKVKSKKEEACKELHKVNTEVPPIKVKGDRSKSVLFDACKLVKDLAAEGRWKVISHVWVEMVAHAATHCGGNNHARQLRQGGELLTHVWLLMAHLGITDQFQISHGHARAKLIVR